jgi:hypothetical protein
MTNEELWERINSLRRQNVATPDGRRTFSVLRVTDTGVVLRGGTGKLVVARATIEAAYALGRNSQALSPAQIRAANLERYDASLLVGLLNAVGADRE